MIEKNVNRVRKTIEETCANVNRNIDEVTLIAVSKQKPFDQIVKTNVCGITDFGENKAKELKQKAENSQLKINWHFIGHLQTNKVKDVVPYASLIHSVDSIKLADEINKRAGNIKKIQKILIEVNTSGEEAKFGSSEISEIIKLAEHCKTLQNIRLLGLMTMAPFTSNDDLVRNSFRSLKNIFGKLNADGFELTELSMGMTNDFKIAIEEGATILRIGTAIFS
ncbi:MAG: YggS family pyridoxal phosphate-dependent enzyme [Melioribacteraceae bacterium]|nr:YggS family pyridoxal phosphate-dependent enzyme [Melioribacteraceae bacterium]